MNFNFALASVSILSFVTSYESMEENNLSKRRSLSLKYQNMFVRGKLKHNLWKCYREPTCKMYANVSIKSDLETVTTTFYLRHFFKEADKEETLQFLTTKNEYETSIVLFTKSDSKIHSLGKFKSKRGYLPDGAESYLFAFIINHSNYLKFIVKTKCSQGQFGSDCDNTCLPSNSSRSGFFDCDKKGNKICRYGYREVVRDCKVKDICYSNPCHNNGTCYIGKRGVSSCLCPLGFAGKDCTKRISCDMKNYKCQNGGVCNSSNISPCSCKKLYSGTFCQHKNMDCNKLNCNRGVSKCHISNKNELQCKCKSGMFGEKCQHDFNECVSNPCQNHGVCANMYGQFKCKCIPPYFGSLCQYCDDNDSSGLCPIKTYQPTAIIINFISILFTTVHIVTVVIPIVMIILGSLIQKAKPTKADPDMPDRRNSMVR